MNNPTVAVWTTFYRIRTADGRELVVQKRDGCTRTVVASRFVPKWSR